MDTSSLMGALGSIDVGSMFPTLAAVGQLVSNTFAAIASVIDLGTTGSAGIAGSIQTSLGSIAGS